jgi:hypothetical protein
MWRFPVDAFDTVYAVSDLHGDVDVAITLFRDVLRVIGNPPEAPPTVWRWVAPPRTCVVVCGDVVDRSRHEGRGGPRYGENERQSLLPDDLVVLHLLNHWARLADVEGSGCKVLRLLGNHEVFGATATSADCVSLCSLRLLAGLEQHDADPAANRCASFATPGAAFFDAIWSPRSVRLLVQIGPYLFTHAGISSRTLRMLHDVDVDDVDAVVAGWSDDVRRAMVQRRLDGLAPGIADILYSRVMALHPDEDDRAGVGILARHLLGRWSAVTGVPAHTLVIGHNTCTPSMCRSATAHVHLERSSNQGDNLVVPTYKHLGLCGEDDDDDDDDDGRRRPWINATVCVTTGRPVVWRLDVGASRA